MVVTHPLLQLKFVRKLNEMSSHRSRSGATVRSTRLILILVYILVFVGVLSSGSARVTSPGHVWQYIITGVPSSGKRKWCRYQADRPA